MRARGSWPALTVTFNMHPSCSPCHPHAQPVVLGRQRKALDPAKVMTPGGLAKLAVLLGTNACERHNMSKANKSQKKNIGYQLLLVGFGCLSDALNTVGPDAGEAPTVTLEGWMFHIQLPTAPTACVPCHFTCASCIDAHGARTVVDSLRTTQLTRPMKAALPMTLASDICVCCLGVGASATVPNFPCARLQVGQMGGHDCRGVAATDSAPGR